MTPQVIDRLVRRPAKDPQDPPLSAPRAVGISVARAAQQALGLSVRVGAIAEEDGDLDALVDGLDDALLILSIARADGGTGMMACNADLVAAALEALTTGRIGAAPQPARAVTNTDALLIRPWFTQILEDLAQTCDGSEMEGWSAACTVGARYETVRAVEFALQDCTYRILRIEISDGTESRRPELIVALPRKDATVRDTPQDDTDNWATCLSDCVMGAPLALDAVLGQVRMSLAQLTGLEVGDSVPLTVKGLDGIALTASDGFVVARGRLGQLDGRIAVRVDLEEEHLERDMDAYPRPGAHRITTVEQELQSEAEAPSLAEEEFVPQAFAQEA
ncbi:hypothetical protein EU805_08960 [Salipiger sp. IMCC34102]|uniref:FliM/FliN family flagellar motor switch protein n=1 Tax=Salipiger sp. IMCC34102 TaxID=2510647 RepID=UPI00101C0203|nr:FliM/FliN family flagellar motor switch protein [Salipiger sp. IMCC34102]RYH02729.1 hypothetical protein EU805_08960 [Salipiger sp. IMCC34102]